MSYNSPKPITQIKSVKLVVPAILILGFLFAIKFIIGKVVNLGGNEGSGLFGKDFLIYIIFSLSFYISSFILTVWGLILTIGDIRQKENNSKMGWLLLIAMFYLSISGFALSVFYGI